MSTRARKATLHRSSSVEQNRTSASWTHDSHNFSHLRGPNPSYADRPDVHSNPLGQIKSTGPATANPDELVEDSSGSRTPTDERATTPTPGGQVSRAAQADTSASTDKARTEEL
ncbi:hypothetical protein BV20DRAFT_962645 [Pilatotrama ljubarskyi]|nr:hypothetical protein BV20DRAFT_962645 [Pilatotrama ljubarskyi]